MSTHNIHFHEEIEKLIPESLNIPLLPSPLKANYISHDSFYSKVDHSHEVLMKP